MVSALASRENAANASSAYAAIDAAQKLSGHNFRSVFLPASLASPVDPEVRQIMPPVFTQLVYPSMRAGLEQKISALVEPPDKPAASPQSLTTFIDALLRLEDNFLLYNRLAANGKGDGRGLLELAGYLYPQAGAGRSAEDSTGSAPWSGGQTRRSFSLSLPVIDQASMPSSAILPAGQSMANPGSSQPQSAWPECLPIQTWRERIFSKPSTPQRTRSTS